VSTPFAFPPHPRALPEEFQGLADELARVLERYPQVALAYVFGSVARRQARADSDLDVGIVFSERGGSARRHVTLLGELAARLEGVGGYEHVDLVVLESQGPIFCHRVLSEGVLVYERDPERRVDFESDTFVRAMDFRPTYDLAVRGQLQSYRRWLRERHDLR
jgi:uncharacterized protein